MKSKLLMLFVLILTALVATSCLEDPNTAPTLPGIQPPTELQPNPNPGMQNKLKKRKCVAP